jgi:dTDP-glucose 4,6-dehydratase
MRGGAMKLLLTGGAGFVGHHLIEGVLKQTAWDIIIIDGLTYAGDYNRIADIECFARERHRFRAVYHDLRSPFTPELHRQIGPVDVVWHLAANSHVDRSLIDALPFAQSTVVGTTNLLQYLRDYQPDLRRYIGFNTDEVFGPAPQGVFHTEEGKFRPSNPYSAAKAGQWAMEFAFAHSFRMPISLVHSMNIFGERQNGEKFVPMTMRNILEGKTVTLHGAPDRPSSRCWIHAREVCNALIFLTDHAENEQAYNVIGEERTVYQLAQKFSEIIGLPAHIGWQDYHSTRPGHDLRYALDGSKLKSMGFMYSYPLDMALETTTRWSIRPENRRWLYT